MNICKKLKDEVLYKSNIRIEFFLIHIDDQIKYDDIVRKRHIVIIMITIIIIILF